MPPTNAICRTRHQMLIGTHHMSLRDLAVSHGLKSHRPRSQAEVVHDACGHTNVIRPHDKQRETQLELELQCQVESLRRITNPHGRVPRLLVPFAVGVAGRPAQMGVITGVATPINSVALSLIIFVTHTSPDPSKARPNSLPAALPK